MAPKKRKVQLRVERELGGKGKRKLCKQSKWKHQPTFKEVVEFYEGIHLHAWEDLSEEEQNKFVEANQEWMLANDDDTEQPDMSQPSGSGLAQSMPITLENVAQTMYDLQQAVGPLAVTMADLAKQVNLVVSTCQCASKISVSIPKGLEWQG